MTHDRLHKSRVVGAAAGRGRRQHDDAPHHPRRDAVAPTTPLDSSAGLRRGGSSTLEPRHVQVVPRHHHAAVPAAATHQLRPTSFRQLARVRAARLRRCCRFLDVETTFHSSSSTRQRQRHHQQQMNHAENDPERHSLDVSDCTALLCSKRQRRNALVIGRSTATINVQRDNDWRASI